MKYTTTKDERERLVKRKASFPSSLYSLSIPHLSQTCTRIDILFFFPLSASKSRATDSFFFFVFSIAGCRTGALVDQYSPATTIQLSRCHVRRRTTTPHNMWGRERQHRQSPRRQQKK